jgi:hypothetical protein
VVVAAYSLVRYYSTVCRLANVRGLNIAHPRRGAATRENIHGDMWRMEVMTTGANDLMESGVLLPRTSITLQSQRISEQYEGCGGELRAGISSWAVGAVTETWREPTNRSGMDQTSKIVVFVAPSDGRLRPHVRDVPSDKYRCAAYVLRSDARIGNGCQKQGWLCYRGIRKQRSSYEAPRSNGGDRFRVVSGSLRARSIQAGERDSPFDTRDATRMNEAKKKHRWSAKSSDLS